MQVNKHLARSVQSLELGLEGADTAVYFTHDYYTLASDKNTHIQTAAKLAKKHGVKNFVAVSPIEHDLAWSEEKKSFYDQVEEAENAALQANEKLTILRTNLAFGPESHLIHFLAQCAIVGKCPYTNLLNSSHFKFAPVYTNDIASVVSDALNNSRPGRFSVNGASSLTLRAILDELEAKAGKNKGSTIGPSVPPLDLLWDFLVGTTTDLNMSRLVEFYEEHPKLEESLRSNPWSFTASESFESWVRSQNLTESAYSQPTFGAYRCAHLD